MSRKYNNAISVNHGLTLNGPTPLDDRIVLDGLESVYVNPSNPEACTLYGNIYRGAIISVQESGEMNLMVLNDDTPYQQGKKIAVTEANYLDFWKSLNKEIEASDIFDGGGSPDSQSTITPTGNLPAGTTIGQLEQMTISEILKKILFEFVTPHKVQNASFSASLTGDYASGKAVEVGAPYPTSSNFSTQYTPEKWQWVSEANPEIKGPLASLSVRGATRYYYNQNNSTTGGTPLPVSVTAVEGTNGYLYVEQLQDAGEHPQDSAGSITDEDGNYYADTRTDTLKAGTFTFKGGWRGYSNATKTYTTAADAWSKRNTNPGGFIGNDAKVATSGLILFNTTHEYYFQWPAGTTEQQIFHIYCPQTYKIDSIFAASNTATNTFDVESGVSDGQTIVTITNSYSKSGPFRSYIVMKAAGITNVKVTFKKV